MAADTTRKSSSKITRPDRRATAMRWLLPDLCRPVASKTFGDRRLVCGRAVGDDRPVGWIAFRWDYAASFSSLDGRNAIFPLAASRIASPVAGFLLPIEAARA